MLYNFGVKWISVKNLHTQSCKFSYYLFVYPIYTRKKVFLQAFVCFFCLFVFFYFADSSIQFWHLVCLLWCFRTYPKQYLSTILLVVFWSTVIVLKKVQFFPGDERVSGPGHLLDVQMRVSLLSLPLFDGDPNFDILSLALSWNRHCLIRDQNRKGRLVKHSRTLYINCVDVISCSLWNKSDCKKKRNNMQSTPTSIKPPAPTLIQHRRPLSCSPGSCQRHSCKEGTVWIRARHLPAVFPRCSQFVPKRQSSQRQRTAIFLSRDSIFVSPGAAAKKDGHGS